MERLFPLQISVTSGVVTFPRIVGSIRAFNLCRSGIPVYGQWYSFLNHYWNRGTCCGPWQGWIVDQSPRLEQYGTGVQFAAIPTSTCVLKIYSTVDDNGAIVTFFGTDPNGNALRTDNGNGTWSDGFQFTLNSPFAVGTVITGNISRVIKPVTQGPIQVSALDTVTGIETPIAAFDAGDTNPAFAQYRLHARQCATPAPTFQSVALVKLKFIPVVSPTDVVMIPNLDALAIFVKGIRFQDQGDRVNGLGYQADAVKELNLQLSDNLPDHQIPVKVNAFGTASPWRSGIGRLR